VDETWPVNLLALMNSASCPFVSHRCAFPSKKSDRIFTRQW